jgi:hypothetical protein
MSSRPRRTGAGSPHPRYSFTSFHQSSFQTYHWRPDSLITLGLPAQSNRGQTAWPMDMGPQLAHLLDQ